MKNYVKLDKSQIFQMQLKINFVNKQKNQQVDFQNRILRCLSRLIQSIFNLFDFLLSNLLCLIILTYYLNKEGLSQIMYIQERQNNNKTFQISHQRYNDDFHLSEKNLFTYQEKITSLENNFMNIQKEYLNKIKQLKAILVQKGKKQILLTSQITNLREHFRLHQDEIKKVTQQCSNQNQKQIDSSNTKKNNHSPGIVKKSLESYKKKIANYSPTNTHKTKQTSGTIMAQNQKSLQNSQKMSMQLKKVNQTLLTSKKLSIYTPIFSKSNDKMQKSNDLIDNKIQKLKNEKINNEQDKRKSFSPKIGSQLKNFLFKSMKNVEPQKVKMPILKNGSPKRIIKNSPLRQIKTPKTILNNQLTEPKKKMPIQDIQECF